MKIAILGTGVFAIAIASLLDKNVDTFTIIGRDNTQLDNLKTTNCNPKYSNYKIKANINTELLKNCNFNNYDILFYCLPTLALQTLNVSTSSLIVFTCKGFRETFLFESITNYVVLSGPSYATELISEKYTSFTVSSFSLKNCELITRIIKTNYCAFYISLCPKSIELFGIFKNIISIGCGLINELDMGKNVEASFIIKMLENIYNTFNINKSELYQPAGIGDIYLSCSVNSRNYRFGKNLIYTTNKTQNNGTLEGLYSLKQLNNKLNDNLINLLYDLIIMCPALSPIEIKTKIINLLNYSI